MQIWRKSFCLAIYSLRMTCFIGVKEVSSEKEILRVVVHSQEISNCNFVTKENSDLSGQLDTTGPQVTVSEYNYIL